MEPTLIELLSDLQTCKREDIQFETLILSLRNKKQRKDEGQEPQHKVKAMARVNMSH